jgi:hypothetical protein
MAHCEHGAFDKETGVLLDPHAAAKRTIYRCPDCSKDVFVRKGTKRVAHYAHRKDPTGTCTYFNRNPSLDQQHKNAQIKLKHFLDNQVEIDIKRNCRCGCGWVTGTIVPAQHPGKGKCEHRFKFNDSQKSADVALLDGDTIISIFEVVHTHYTRERDRPEPWFEISAKEINAIPSDSTKVKLTCIRQIQSKECIEETAKRKIQSDIDRKKWAEGENERFLKWCKEQDRLAEIAYKKREEEHKKRQEEHLEMDETNSKLSKKIWDGQDALETIIYCDECAPKFRYLKPPAYGGATCRSCAKTIPAKLTRS